MLEDSCHLFDIKIAASHAISNKIIKHSEFDLYVEKQIQIRRLEYVVEDCDEKINLIQDAIASNLIRNPENEEHIRTIYEPRIKYLISKKEEKVYFKPY